MENPKQLYDKAKQLFDEEKYNEAIDAFKTVLELEPENIDAWINLGLSYRHNEEYDKAIEAYHRVLKVDPKNKIAWNNIGWAHQCKNDMEWAIDAYKRSLDIDPAYELALVNLINVFNDRKEYDNSIEILSNALDIDPMNLDNWIDLGYAYRRIEEYEKAIESYNNALKLNPNSKLAWNNIGWAHFLRKELSMAIDSFKQALKIDWRYDLPVINLDSVYQSMMEENNEDYTNWKSLAKTYLIGKAFEQALDACNQWLELKPNLKEAVDFREKIIKSKEKYEVPSRLKKRIGEALDMYSFASRSCKIKDIIEYIKFKYPTSKIQEIEVKISIIEMIKSGSLKAELDGDKINFN